MTFTEEKLVPQTDPQALIEEARRHRRRRWRCVVGTVAAVAVVGSVAYLVGGGGGSTGSASDRSRLAGLPVGSPRARWHMLTGDGLPVGSTVSSIVNYEGTLYAGGTYFSGGRPAPGYPLYSEPFVWTSTDGGAQWHSDWPSTSGVVAGTGADHHLLSTPIGLFLFAGGTPGSAMWRLGEGANGGEGSHFERVALPAQMTESAIDGAAWSRGRLVVLESDKYATPNGGSAVIWSSSNGVSWVRDRLTGEPYLGSLVASSWGFVAGGRSSPTTEAEVWTSTDGITWSAGVLGPSARRTAVIASRGANVVAVDAQAVPARLWWSDDGATWTTASVVGRLVDRSLGVDAIVSGAFGFVVPGKRATALWYSEDGRRWVRLRDVGAPAGKARLDGLFSVPGGLLAVVSHGDRPDSFWRVTIGPADASG